MALSTNLYSYHQFEENTWTTSVDEMANVNITLSNSGMWSAVPKLGSYSILPTTNPWYGTWGWTWTFDAIPKGTSNWTLNVWCHVSSAMATMKRVLSSTPGWDNSWFELLLWDTGWNFYIWYQPYWGLTLLNLSGSLTTWSKWVMLTITYDSALWTKYNVYINGTSVASWNPATAFNTSSHAATIVWNYIFPAGAYAFNDNIDELAFWTRALSAAEITQIYNGWLGLSLFTLPSSSNFLSFF